MRFPLTMGEYITSLEQDLEVNQAAHKEIAKRLAQKHRNGNPRWMADTDVFFWLQHQVQTKAYRWLLNTLKTCHGELLNAIDTQVDHLRKLAAEEKGRLAEAFENLNGRLPDGSHLSTLEIEEGFLIQRRTEIAFILKRESQLDCVNN